METLTRLTLIASLACICWLSYRLDAETTAHRAAIDRAQREKVDAIVAERDKWKTTITKLEKINDESQAKLDTVASNLDAANRAGVGMRKQLATFAKRDSANGASTTKQCEAEQSRVDLLAKLLTELDGVAGEYALEADTARERGAACELSYETMK